MRWIIGDSGTWTILPTHAVELTLPHEVLSVSGANGWCVHREHISTVLMELLSTRQKLSLGSLIAVRRLAVKVSELPPETTHVILLPDGLNYRMTQWRSAACAHTALVNHERSHARTVRKSMAWHTFVDGYMWMFFSDEWDACIIALLDGSGLYGKQLAAIDDDPTMVSWLIVEELLARVCSMMHAPRDDASRVFVSRRELKRNAPALLALVKRLETHWESPEQIVGWLDAVHLTQLKS